MEEVSKALSVSAAVSLAKSKLESITVKVVGEVSELSNKPGYKAVYFTLKDKDENAVLKCMMWMNRYAAAGVAVEIGSVVEITGRFSLYAAKGTMNFDVFDIALEGEGDLRVRIAKLIQKLNQEGLMAPEKKKPLPDYPLRIGLVTSPRGAVVHDVLRTLRRRYPLAEVLVAGVPVEGKDAPQNLIEGLAAVELAGAEVVILCRGGGSFEDFMPFNDEGLARYIASMNIPVVTGIGHEPDTCIADMVADKRASTPTAAAEALAPAISDISAQLLSYGRRMGYSLIRVITQLQNALLELKACPVFAHPVLILQDYARRLDDCALRLETSLPACIKARFERLTQARISLFHIGSQLLTQKRQSVEMMRQTFINVGSSLVKPYQEKVSVHAASLEGLSPLAVLSRGYAAVFDNRNNVISSTSQIAVADQFHVQFSDGRITCTADEVILDSLL